MSNPDCMREARSLGQADVIAKLREIRWHDIPADGADVGAIQDIIFAALDTPEFEGAYAILDGNDE